MKALLVSSSFPYPVDVGRKVIISGFLEYLVSTLGAANVTFAYVASSEDGMGRDPGPSCDVIPLPLDPIPRRIARAGWQSLLRKRFALQEMMLYSRRAAIQLKDLVRSTAPDLVLVDTVRVAQYCDAFQSQPPRSVLYLDDLYSLRYQRMLSAMRAHPEMGLDCLGTFGRFLPGSVCRIARGQTVQRCLLGIESQLLEKREAELPRRFDSVLLLNPEEASRLSRDARSPNVSTVKPLLRGHRDRLPRAFRGEPTFVFLGNLRYPANAYSLSLFLRLAMPRLVQADSRSKLIVVGRTASNFDWEAEGRRWEGHVQFLDFVEDLAPLMSTAAAMVVPLVYGSGLKMKVLDALYYGLPIVTTSMGMDGLPAASGKECFIEDDLAAFVEPLMLLLDIDLNNRMSTNAQALYAAQFAPEVVWNQYQSIFGTP